MTKVREIPVHMVFTVVYVLLAAVTSIPMETASKACLLGYKSLCSFVPISTLILLALAGLHIYLHSRRPEAGKMS